MPSERPNLLERIDQGRVKFELLGTPQSLARLGRFVVFARIGAGGMGVIYHAYDPELDRGVAIKLLRPSVTGGRRLLREARAMARLAHPNVIQVFEVGELEDQVYLVMEFVAGQTLRAWLAETTRSWREVVSVFLQAADGLAATHAHGLVHCDFKPENVLLGADGRVRVGDFGLVQGEADASSSPLLVRSEVQERRQETVTTSASLGGGTPLYMAPEQHERRAADARSDQYSFCAALYEALAPAQFESFVRDAPLGLRALRGELPALLAVPGAPPELGRVVARGLERDPEQRWPSMSALRVELARLVAPRPRGRGWRWGLVAGTVVGLLAGVGYGFVAAGEAACDSGAAQIAAAWGEPQRQEVRAAIAATGLGFAADTGARVETQLDAYARSWSAAHRAACEAHRSGQTSDVLLDRAMLCLAAERGALAGLVQRLVAIEADELERAMQAVLGLPDVARCRDAQALLAEVAPPTDVATTQAVLGVQSQLAAVRSEWTLGHLDDAMLHAVEALARAQAIGHAPLIARALYHVGKLHHTGDARAEAEATLARAAWLAAEVGDGELLAFAAAPLAHVISLSGGRGAEVRTWIRLARVMSQRTSPRGRAHFDALFESGNIEFRAGRFAEAGNWHAQALAHAEQHFGPRSQPAFIALGMIAASLGERGEYDAALAQFERIVDLQEEVFGRSHPVLAAYHNNRAAILRQAGRADEALAGFWQALEIWRDAYGPDHPDVGMAHGNIASALLTRARAGDFEAAEPHLRRAIETRERSLGPDDLDLAIDISNLGDLHRLRLELDEAEREYARAIAIYERTPSGEHPRIVLPLMGLAGVAWLRGDVTAQRRYYQRVLKIQESSFGPDYPEIASTLRGLAEAALQDGALDLAEHYMVRASALDAKVGEDEERTLASLALRGQLALRRGDPVVASELLARSLRGSEDRELDPYIAQRSSSLAHALMAVGRADEARPLIERAAAYFRRGGPALAWQIDALEALLPRPRGREYTRADVRTE